MTFHTGPTKPALVLLCCIGTWLVICNPSFGVPTAKIRPILIHLKLDSEKLYENYSKCQAGGMQTNESLQLPCFTLGCGASANISTIQAYLEEVERLNENTTSTAHVRKRLNDIRCSNTGCPNPRKPSISGPKDPYKIKSFTLTVFKRLSDCMANLKAKDSIC
ncbi:interleukin-31 [Peromyscus eremicus]|uniref:interleukin-31 n=1 Tax=Peromyscus eremicus TaxID=42410 RepID=UPI0027DDCCF3|nr:interleukin-31 [Peromyscus eremicus]